MMWPKQTKTKKTLQNNLTLNKQMQCASCRPDSPSGKPKINLEILLLKEMEACRGDRAGFTYRTRAKIQVSPLPMRCSFHPRKEGRSDLGDRAQKSPSSQPGDTSMGHLLTTLLITTSHPSIGTKCIYCLWVLGWPGFPHFKKLLEENTGRTLSDINHSKILYDPPPRVMQIKTKINKWGLIKLESFCATKEKQGEKTALRMEENNSKQNS